MSKPPLHHIVRIRRSEDLIFVRDGLMDEVLVNANQVENSPDSTATALRQTRLPFAIEPMLHRFQVPAWWRNAKGETKRNYARLAAAYTKDTSVQMATGGLLETIHTDEEWRTLGANAINFQQLRLAQLPAQLDLFSSDEHRALKPVRVMAPSLVAYSPAEDRVNGLLVDGAGNAAQTPLSVSVIVPIARLLDPSSLTGLLASVPTDGAAAYFVWTPDVTEELLLRDHRVFAAVLRLITTLAERGIPIGHLHASYAIAALHDIGVSAAVHHLGWADKGEPADQTRGGLRSCQSYVPGVRHSVYFEKANDLGRSLGANDYAERYCECGFCVGSFAAGQHPLDLLLEDQLVPFKNGRDRRTPTSRAVTLNTWHYLLSRRQEIQAFSEFAAAQVVDNDIDRASSLAGRRDSDRLVRLANQLRSA